MKVKRMIELLKKYNPDATVKLHHYLGEEALFVVGMANNNNIVWLEAADDNDMSSEISARFENAIETQIDELDFYMDLLDTGITVDMVREFMDDEHADHMYDFCKEHGLI